MAKQVLIWGLVLLSMILVSSDSFQRTVVFIRVETQLGENVFLRGGRKGICSSEVTKDACAIPIRHRLVNSVPQSSSFYQWSAGDHYIDWHGAERDQGAFGGEEAGGTPLVWTTSQKGGPVLQTDGYGYTSLNQFGSHFWLMDVDMDCSMTDQGWFQFKVFVTPKRGWEADILQTSSCGGQSSHKAPFSGRNHMAECGKFNLFYYDNGGCVIDNITTASSIKDHLTTPQHCGTRLPTVLDKRSIWKTKEGIKESVTTSDTYSENVIGIRPALSIRILHGHPAPKGRWPWMGEILYKGSHGCGAVLISPSWAITAGHCVRIATAFGRWGLILRFGELDRHSISGTERDYFVKRIIKHPLFDRDDDSIVDNDNDIALLELAYPVVAPGVTPACLPGHTWGVDQFVGQDCWAVGQVTILESYRKLKWPSIRQQTAHVTTVGVYLGVSFVPGEGTCLPVLETRAARCRVSSMAGGTSLASCRGVTNTAEADRPCLPGLVLTYTGSTKQRG